MPKRKGYKLCGLTALIMADKITCLECRRPEAHPGKCRATIRVVGYRDIERKHLIEWVSEGDGKQYESR